MKRFLNLFRSNRAAKPATSRRPQRACLEVEGLEERWMPSASSTAMHSVVEPATGRTVAVFHLNDNPNNALFENTGPGQFQQIAPALAVRDFSVGLDPTGHAAVFAEMNGDMQEFTQTTGWVPLHQPVPMRNWAAVQNGDVYAAAVNDLSLWQFTPQVYHPVSVIIGGNVYHGGYYTGGWQKDLAGIESPATFGASSIDAVTSHGQDIVVGMNGFGQLSWYLPSTGYLDSFSGTVNTYSVGLDANGYFDVFVVFGGVNGGIVGSVPVLQEYDPSQGGWQHIINTFGDITPFATLSATSGGQCFVSSSVLWEYSPNISASGGFVQVPGAPSTVDISAAGADNLIVMETSGHLDQYSGTGYPNDTWRSLSITPRVI